MTEPISGNSTPSTNRTKKREALFVQLHDVFVRRGYDGATLANLSAATGLSKASLYHHFPGGKAEMAESLVRMSIAELHKSAFSHLQGGAPATQRMTAFVDGFADYCGMGNSHCLLAVFSHHSAADDRLQNLQAAIAGQFDDWQILLAEVYQQLGRKPKKAMREAAALLAALYGALLLSKMRAQPGLFRSAVKQQKKNFSTNTPPVAI